MCIKCKSEEILTTGKDCSKSNGKFERERGAVVCVVCRRSESEEAIYKL